MDSITRFDISEPVMHVSSGKFTASKHWQHKHMYHNGNFEIIIMIKGTVYLQVDKRFYNIRAGESFILPPYHHLHGFKESPEGTQYFWFHFFTKPNGSQSMKIDHQDNHLTESLFQRQQIVLPLQFKILTIDKVFLLANQVLDVVKSHYFTTMSADYLLTTLLIELSQEYFKTISAIPSSTEEARIDEIKAWIRANLSESLKVSDVANAFTLNPHYLVRIFKSQTSKTVIQYINDLKLQRAKELLLRTNLPIKQVASMALYTDEKRFMKVFKSTVNLTPTQFRLAYTKKFLDSSSFDPEVPITKSTEAYRERFNE